MKLKKLEYDDIKNVVDFIKSNPQKLSLYNPATISLWNGCIYDVYFTIEDNILIIAEVEIENSNNKRLMLPVGKKIASEKLKDIMNLLGYKYVYYVSEEYINENRNELEQIFAISRQEEYDDYVYLTSDLSELKGSKYSPKRNLINQFLKNYSDLFEIKPLAVENIDDVIELTNNVYKQISTEKAFNILACEKKAIENIKKLWGLLEFKGVCIYINKQLKSFAIGSRLNPETYTLNFEKADKNIKGLYQFVDREFAKLVRNDCLYINKESDLGKELLKKAKESYHPVFKLNSYILELK
jgi:hypothetical protein